MKKKIWLGLAALATVAVLYGVWKIVYPPAFLPHSTISIGLPFMTADMPSSMIPMGETIYHPKPQVPHGHPGIDFLWTSGDSHAVVAAAAGTFASKKMGASEPGKWDIEIRSGQYLLRYKELDDYADLKLGAHIDKGQVVGHAGHYCDNQHCWFNVHWELASTSTVLDRWCPVNYFDTASKATLEQVWNSVPSTDKVKSQFPNVCNGDYAHKQEKGLANLP